MTFYLNSIDTFSLSRTVSKKNRFKILKVAQNGGIWPFQSQGHWPIFFISKIGSDSSQTALTDIERQNRFSCFGCTLSKSLKSFKKRKKRTSPYMLGICTSVPENFPYPNFARLFRSMTLSIVPNIFQSVHSLRIKSLRILEDLSLMIPVKKILLKCGNPYARLNQELLSHMTILNLWKT